MIVLECLIRHRPPVSSLLASLTIQADLAINDWELMCQGASVPVYGAASLDAVNGYP